MPRQPRLDVPGALHHIMVRGSNEVAIFSDDQDSTRFLQRLGEAELYPSCLDSQVRIRIIEGEICI